MTFDPTSALPERRTIGSVQIDSFALVLLTVGILLAIAVAILVGQATARLFFHASRGHVEDAVNGSHKASP